MTSRVRHNITTGAFVGFVLCPLAALFSVPQVNTLVEAERMQTASMAPSQQVRDRIWSESNMVSQGSEIPLNLVSINNCSPMVLANNGELPEFVPGVEVVAQTPEGQRLPPGSHVCNRAGKSAIVGVDYTLKDVQSTPLEKLEEYQVQFDLMLELQGRM